MHLNYYFVNIHLAEILHSHEHLLVVFFQIVLCRLIIIYV